MRLAAPLSRSIRRRLSHRADVASVLVPTLTTIRFASFQAFIPCSFAYALHFTFPPLRQLDLRLAEIASERSPLRPIVWTRFTSHIGISDRILQHHAVLQYAHLDELALLDL